MAKAKKIKIACEGADAVDFKKIIPFQGDLKDLSTENYQKLKSSILTTGFNAPIHVWKSKGKLFNIDGHQRIRLITSLAEEGYEIPPLPINYIHAKSKKQAKEILLSHVSEYGTLTGQGLYEYLHEADLEWDDIKEKMRFPDIDFEAFEAEYFADTTGGGNTDDDAVPDNVKSVVKPGQLWQLGGHRLLCGDATDEKDVNRLMDGAKADVVFTDPPYNVNYSNQDRPKPGKKDLGRIDNDKMSDENFNAFLSQSLTNAFNCSGRDASIYIWYASKETINFHTATTAAGWTINQQIIWVKPMLLGRGRYQWAHEPCLFGVKGTPFFTKDRTKTTVWNFGGYDKSKNEHPTQKPVFLAVEGLENSTQPQANTLDLFGGSGSTLIACEKTDRQCFMMEIDPHYCDVIIKRWEEYTEETAEKIDG